MSIQQNNDPRDYIKKMDVGDPLPIQGAEPVNAIDVNSLPDGLVTGSNLIQFPENASPEIKSSVALSLLAAQRVASNDPKVSSPDRWFESHNEVLKNLNWLDEGGGSVKAEFKDLNVAVHEAIIPFLTAAFGGAVGAGALIISALNQLKEIDKGSPWITLFDRASRRFNVTEYQFSVVEVVGDKVFLKLAAARLDAFAGKTQVLFIRVNKEQAEFSQINKKYSTQVALLSEMNADLQVKLSKITRTFIQGLPDLSNDSIADAEGENETVATKKEG